MIITITNVLSVLLMLCVIPTVWLVYRKKIKFFNGVFLGTFLFLMSFVCSMYSVHIEYGYTPYDIFATNTQRMIYAYSTTPGITSGQLQALKSAVAQLQNFYTTLLPALIVLANLLLVYMIFMISKGVFAIFKKDVSGFTKFCNLKMPGMAILLALLSYILSDIVNDTRLGYAFMNFAVIIFNVCTVCGMSAIDYAVRKKIRLSVVRFIIYVAVFIGFGNFLSTILPFIGIVDGILNFRRIGVESSNK